MKPDAHLEFEDSISCRACLNNKIIDSMYSLSFLNRFRKKIPAMKEREKLPLKVQIAYPLGLVGVNILITIVNLQLVYFYIPPDNSGIPYFIKQAVFLGIINTVSIIVAAGRLWAAFIDPVVASRSDRSRHRQGRRIPFLRAAIIPLAVTCVLLFYPPVGGVSPWNVAWLFAVQLVFFLFLSFYMTPFMALLPELGRTVNERVNLSIFLSIGWAMGIMGAAVVPAFSGFFEEIFSLTQVSSLQWAIILMAGVSALLMAAPVFVIDEKKYCHTVPSEMPMIQSLRRTFGNIHFRYYIIADFAFMVSEAIITCGIFYYVTVLLELPKSRVALFMSLMVILSLAFYPLVKMMSRGMGKKIPMVLSTFVMGIDLFLIYFLGRMPVPVSVQFYALALVSAVPLSFMGTLPTAVLSDIAQHDMLKTGNALEGMYFSSRSIMIKLGMTTGILIFAVLTTLGKDPGDDFGIRASGLVGFVLCVVSALAFTRYRETQVMDEINQALNEKIHR